MCVLNLVQFGEMLYVFPNTQTWRSVSSSGQIHSISLLELILSHFGSCQWTEDIPYDQPASDATCFPEITICHWVFYAVSCQAKSAHGTLKYATEDGGKI